MTLLDGANKTTKKGASGEKYAPFFIHIILPSYIRICA